MQLSKMGSFTAALLLACAVSAAVVSEKEIPIRNADFSAVKNGTPAGWWKSKGLAATYGKDGKTPFVTLKTDKELGWPALSQAVMNVKDLPALKAGESYEFVLTYRQKSVNIDKHAFGGVAIVSKTKRLLYRDGRSFKGTTDGWKKTVVTLKVPKLPEDAQQVRISFYLHGTGSVSYADAKLVVKVVKPGK